MKEMPDKCTDEHLEYLDELRGSGKTNMFGATPYLALEAERKEKEIMKNEITDAKLMAEELHSCGLDAYSCPVGDRNRGHRNLSAFDWNNFRREVATELLKRFKIVRKP